MKKIILVSMLMLAVLVLLKNVKANTTTMYVEPQTSNVEIFATFQINISISQVNDLAAWEFKLYYLNEYLNATQIHEGPFLKTAGQTFFLIKEFTDNYNTTHGIIWASCTLIGQGSGATGSGILATMTFKAKQAGTTTLKLAETDMLDSQMPPNHITHTTADGTVNILGHDIAVTDVNPLKTIVGQGYTMHINVTVANQGTFTETFNVTVYANTTTIETRELTLTSGATTTITFTWNTSGFVKGNYTLWAFAWPVPSETDTVDNTLANGLILVNVAGDVSSAVPGVPDYIVNARDVTYLILLFDIKPESPNWNSNADINDDLVINARDATIAVLNFMKTFEDP